MAETLGSRIRWARETTPERGGPKLSQDALADACGWHGAQGRVGNYERDERVPSLDDIQTIGRITRTAPGWLAFGDQPATDVNVELLADLLASVQSAVTKARRADVQIAEDLPAQIVARLYARYAASGFAPSPEQLVETLSALLEIEIRQPLRRAR